MINSKLFQIIQSFAPEEKEAFSLFLKSPFHVRGGADEMLRYFSCLTDSNRQIDSLDKETLHALVFPDKPFSEARFERATTRLYKIVEQFLTIQQYQLEENEPKRMLDLAVSFRKKNLDSLYEKQILKLKKSAGENNKESVKNYLHKYQIAREEHIKLSLANTGKTDLGISDMLENLHLFYNLELIEMINLFSLQQKLGNPPLTEALEYTMAKPHVSDYMIQKSPLIYIRTKIQDYFFQSDANQEMFEYLDLLIKKYENQIDQEEVADLYGFLRSYCTFLISVKNLDLYAPLHEIQKYSLKKGYFHYMDKINSYNFLNITRVALNINKIEWAKDFIDSQRHKIWGEGESEELYKLNKALCLFEEKKYEDALQNIMYNFFFVSYFLVARRLELRIYYELKFDLLPYKIDAFRKYIERESSKKVSEMDRVSSVNFINMLLQLSQKSPNSAKRSAQIIQRINQKKLLAERRWLLVKAHELAVSQPDS
ncbi:MAG: hypothetical protein JNN28_17045 [Saprospiraceae bacterium]|nr:hypothetical protein [Saprospiraceae bacterium]